MKSCLFGRFTGLRALGVVVSGGGVVGEGDGELAA